MKAGWETRRLGEVCRVVGGGTPSKARADYYGGDIPWATIRDLSVDEISSTEHSITKAAVRESATNVIPAGSIVVASRVGLGKSARLLQDTAINQDIRALLPIRANQLDSDFLFWLMKFLGPRFVAAGRGATVQGVTLPFIKGLELPIPPLAEQRRIVEVLDEAFAALATATANTEQTLTNARELFKSCLARHFTQLIDDGAPATALDDLTTTRITYGVVKPGPPGTIPFVRGGDLQNGDVAVERLRTITEEVSEQYSRTLLQGGELLICLVGVPGQTAVVPPRLRGANIARQVGLIRLRADIRPEFASLYFRSGAGQAALGLHTGGSVQQVINLGDLRTVQLPVPNEPRQRETENKMSEAESLVEAVESAAQQKLTLLAELRQSLLARAFACELTQSINLPQCSVANDNFSGAEFAANVIAFAFEQHEAAGTQATFGRVKAQKFLQLVETEGRIDLGREPIKDAAGPNDFQHMLRAQNWAEQSEFFTFEERTDGSGFRFTKLNRYEEMIKTASAATAGVGAELMRAVRPIVSKNSRQAELLVTVQAAWNNVILNGEEPTDESIIHEARGNWTPSKRAIPRAEFVEALREVRRLGIEPDGTAKRVTGQERLL